MVKQIRPAERGKGGIERFEQIFVEAVHETPEGVISALIQGQCPSDSQWPLSPVL